MQFTFGEVALRAIQNEQQLDLERQRQTMENQARQRQLDISQQETDIARERAKTSAMIEQGTLTVQQKQLALAQRMADEQAARNRPLTPAEQDAIRQTYFPDSAGASKLDTIGSKKVGDLTDQEMGDLTAAIVKNEGGFDTTLARTHSNPGNLKYGPATARLGAMKGQAASDGGNFAYFPDAQTGVNAIGQLLKSGVYKNMDVDSALKKYSNGGYGAEILGTKQPQAASGGGSTPANMPDLPLDEVAKLAVAGAQVAESRARTNEMADAARQRAAVTKVLSAPAQKMMDEKKADARFSNEVFTKDENGNPLAPPTFDPQRLKTPGTAGVLSAVSGIFSGSGFSPLASYVATSNVVKNENSYQVKPVLDYAEKVMRSVNGIIGDELPIPGSALREMGKLTQSLKQIQNDYLDPATQQRAQSVLSNLNRLYGGYEQALQYIHDSAFTKGEATREGNSFGLQQAIDLGLATKP